LHKTQNPSTSTITERDFSKMDSQPASPKKEKHIEGAAWASPEDRQASTSRPEEYLVGGCGDREREMANLIAMKRHAPIKMEGSSSIKNNPFVTARHEEPL
jgi:hypothetical protein